MESRKMETTPESTGEGQAKQPRPPERKRRFQIVKLEERIAPSWYNMKHYGNGQTQWNLYSGCRCRL